MVLVISGDFEPEKIIGEVKKRLIENQNQGEIKRIYPEEPETIVQEFIEQKLEVMDKALVAGPVAYIGDCDKDIALLLKKSKKKNARTRIF